ncbi:MAG: hypothetical protein RL291_1225, partial [Pseudomonadota bacterium]
ADEPSLPMKGRTVASLKDRAPVAQRIAARRALAQTRGQERDWLYDYVSRVKDGRLWNDIVGQPLPEPQPKWRKRGTRMALRPVAATRIARPSTALPRTAEAAPQPALKPTVPVVAVTPSIIPVPPSKADAPKAPEREVTTGALQTPGQPLDEDEILERAEKSQAALDLVKLELAARSYEEQKTAGERVFIERPEWKVLENALDSMTDSERQAAVAAGFLAHTYVNDTTKTIVIAVAGTQDLRRDFITADLWQALIRSEAPQHFYFAKSYVKSVIRRYQMQGYVTECVGHSLGGGACAYAAAEVGVRGFVVNPISAGSLPPTARSFVTNYIVDGDIASIVYPAVGNEISGEIRRISNGRDRIRAALKDKYGLLAGPILVVRDAASAITNHQISRALERIAVHAGVTRPR